MRKEPLVSVIIPFYRGVDWLYDAIDSVLSQTYTNFEIIVINDGSPECVDNFLAKYGGKITYVYKDNGGAATARNIGLNLAKGDYIAFLDSDDVWLPNKTSLQIDFMEKNKIKWSHTGYYNWYPDVGKLQLKDNSKDFGCVYIQSFLSLRAPTPAIIIKKECFDEHPEFLFFEDMRFAQDAALWSLIAYYYPLGLLDKPLIKVRQRGTNADLSVAIRFSSKSIIYYKIKEKKYKEVPFYVKCIFRYYNIGNIFLKKIKNKKMADLFGKVLCVPPYIIERFCVFILCWCQNKKYYTK